MKLFLPLTIVVCALPVWAQNPLSVRVLDESGKPIMGAVVAARTYGKDAPVIAPQTTDANGKITFSLPNDKDGKPAATGVEAGARGYSFGEAESSGGPQAVALEIRLARGQIWRGKVLNEAGKPLAGARIEIEGATKAFDFGNSLFLQSDAVKALYSAQSQADGSFEIAGLPANKRLFYRVSKPNFAPVTSQSGRVDNPETFVMVRSGALRGRALDVAGKPLTGIEIFATSRTESSMEISDLAPTDANGDFLIEGLPPGAYKLDIGSPSNAPFLMPELKGVRVEVGKTAAAGEWRAIEGAQIRGLVVDAVTKKPVAGASFAARTKADEKTSDDSAWATSDATGHFVLRVLPGDYRVRVGGPAAGYLSSSAIQSAQPREGAPAQIRFELQSAPVVRGITRDESGAPIQAQLLVGMFGQSLETDAQGRWQYEPYNANDITFGGGEDDEGYFEIISPKRVDFPAKGPIVVTVRRKPWQSLAGRVVTSEGAPVEGAKVTARFTVQTSDRGGRGAQVSALSDAEGRYVLRQLRDSRRPNVMGTEVEVSAKKDGFQFQSGGKVTREGKEPRVGDLVFVPLSEAIKGTTLAGALVVAAGRQTRADDAGRFGFEALPQGKTRIYAAKDGLFGSALTSQQPLAIALTRPTLQGRDEALAREIWAKNVVGQVGESVRDLEQWPKNGDFIGELRRAQRSGEERQIAYALGQLKPTDAPESAAIAREILGEMAPSEARTGAYLRIALADNNADLTDRALELAQAQFETKTEDSYARERQLYQAAVLTERRDGAQAGALALRRALAYTLGNHPDKSRYEGARQTVVGQSEALGRLAVPTVALGSPALLRELLSNIESDSGFAIRARLEAIPIVARANGYKAALPLLEDLRKLPAPTAEGELRTQSADLDWALGSALQSLIPFVGPPNPALALDWAKKIKGDEQRARALASAARYQSLDVAAPLLREAIEKIGSEDAPRVAAYAYERDEKLGLELFEVARHKAEAEMKSPLNPLNSWIPFAFYYARANPAQARLILEREWALSRQAKADEDELEVIAAAMAPLDAARAAEMANELGGNGGLNAHIRIARYLVADEATRRGLALNRSGARQAWDVGELQW